MSELVRATVADTVRLLSGLIASPDAVDDFAEFFNQIGERHFVMTVNDAKCWTKEEGVRPGCLVTITVHDKGSFELLQGFLPIEYEMYHKTGKRYFTGFLVPKFGDVWTVTSYDDSDDNYNVTG